VGKKNHPANADSANSKSPFTRTSETYISQDDVAKIIREFEKSKQSKEKTGKMKKIHPTKESGLRMRASAPIEITGNEITPSNDLK
jgi:hypothetical protein